MSGPLSKERLDPWRDTVAWIAKGRRRWAHAFIAEHGLPLVVRVVIPFDVERRRDPSNFTGSVVKACVDGLQIAKWIPDDTPQWIEVADPLLTIGGNPRIEFLL